MRLPAKDQSSLTHLKCDVRAPSSAQAGWYIADKGYAVGGALEPHRVRAGCDTPRWRGRNAAQQRTHNSRGGIELRSFANAARLRVPEREAGAHALGKPDHQKSEHHEHDQHFEQCEPGLPAEPGSLRQTPPQPPLPPVPRRNVLSTTD